MNSAIEMDHHENVNADAGRDEVQEAADRILHAAKQDRPNAVKSGQRRPLTEAEQRLLDREVAEARQQVSEEMRDRTVKICQLCDQLGQPHLATRLIEVLDEDPGTDEVQEMADRILGARA